MYGLIEFKDKSKYAVRPILVPKQKRWKMKENGDSFKGKLVVRYDSKNDLQNIVNNLNEKLPLVSLGNSNLIASPFNSHEINKISSSLSSHEDIQSQKRRMTFQKETETARGDDGENFDINRMNSRDITDRTEKNPQSDLTDFKDDLQSIVSSLDHNLPVVSLEKVQSSLNPFKHSLSSQKVKDLSSIHSSLDAIQSQKRSAGLREKMEGTSEDNSEYLDDNIMSSGKKMEREDNQDKFQNFADAINGMISCVAHDTNDFKQESSSNNSMTCTLFCSERSRDYLCQNDSTTDYRDSVKKEVDSPLTSVQSENYKNENVFGVVKAGNQDQFITSSNDKDILEDIHAGGNSDKNYVDGNNVSNPSNKIHDLHKHERLEELLQNLHANQTAKSVERIQQSPVQLLHMASKDLIANIPNETNLVTTVQETDMTISSSADTQHNNQDKFQNFADAINGMNSCVAHDTNDFKQESNSNNSMKCKLLCSERSRDYLGQNDSTTDFRDSVEEEVDSPLASVQSENYKNEKVFGVEKTGNQDQFITSSNEEDILEDIHAGENSDKNYVDGNNVSNPSNKIHDLHKHERLEELLQNLHANQAVKSAERIEQSPVQLLHMASKDQITNIPNETNLVTNVRETDMIISSPADAPHSNYMKLNIQEAQTGIMTEEIAIAPDERSKCSPVITVQAETRISCDKIDMNTVPEVAESISSHPALNLFESIADSGKSGAVEGQRGIFISQQETRTGIITGGLNNCETTNGTIEFLGGNVENKLNSEKLTENDSFGLLQDQLSENLQEVKLNDVDMNNVEEKCASIRNISTEYQSDNGEITNNMESFIHNDYDAEPGAAHVADSNDIPTTTIEATDHHLKKPQIVENIQVNILKGPSVAGYNPTYDSYSTSQDRTDFNNLSSLLVTDVNMPFSLNSSSQKEILDFDPENPTIPQLSLTPSAKKLRNTAIESGIESAGPSSRDMHKIQNDENEVIRGYDSDISELEDLQSDDEFYDDCEEIPVMRDSNFNQEFDLECSGSSSKMMADEVPVPFVSDESDDDEDDNEGDDEDDDEDDDDSVKDKHYISETESDDSDEDSHPEKLSNRDSKCVDKRKTRSPKKRAPPFSNDSSLNDSVDLNETLPKGAPMPHQLAVPTSRSGRKANFCYFCKDMKKNISRHLLIHTKDSEEVRELEKYPKGDPIRRELIKKLHNTNPNYNRGTLLPTRRPREELNRGAGDFAFCHNCRAVFANVSIRHHRIACTGQSSEHDHSNAARLREVSGRIHPAASKRFQTVIFPILRNDEITREIASDQLLWSFGSQIAIKYTKQNQHDLIRSRLRLLARITRTARGLNDQITDFSSIFHPRMYKTVIEAINIEGKYNATSGKYEVPSVAITSGTWLKKAGNFLKTECIKNENQIQKQQVEDFLTVHANKFNSQVSHGAVLTQLKRNRQKKKALPLTEDVKKLWDYLTNLCNENITKLEQKYSFDIWKSTAETILMTIQIFNRKRAGEIERFELNDIATEQRIDENTNPEIYQSLSKKDQIAVSKYVRYEICGKLNRMVPILVSEQMAKGIKLILKYRSNGRVSTANPYVFGLPGFETGRFKHLRACELLRKYSNECGAQQPELLRGTALRKHMATICATKNVDENQILDVANFLGHSENIHRRHYRQTAVNRDVSGISRFLEQAIGMATVDNDELDSDKDTQDDDGRSHENTDESGANTSQDSQDDIPISPDHQARSRRVVPMKKRKNNVNLSTEKDEIPAKRTRKMWSQEEKDLAYHAFRSNIRQKTKLTSEAIRKFLLDNPQIERTEAQVRTWVSNEAKQYRTRMSQ